MSPKDHHSIHPLFAPRSIAIVGASRRRDSIGYCMVDNLLKNQFTGTLYPVNPKAEAVHSLKCYPSVLSIEDPVDLALIVVPRDFVEGAVDECIQKKVKGLVVITAGFGETGQEGAQMEKRILKKIRAAGIRMIGPNCMGIINTDPEVCLNATFAPTPARRGSVGFVSQSGALGVAILNEAESLGLGLTQLPPWETRPMCPAMTCWNTGSRTTLPG